MLIILSQKISILIKCIIEVWRREGGGGGGHPNDKKVVVRGMLKSAIKSMHWKVAPKKQVQLLFSI